MVRVHRGALKPQNKLSENRRFRYSPLHSSTQSREALHHSVIFLAIFPDTMWMGAIKNKKTRSILPILIVFGLFPFGTALAGTKKTPFNCPEGFRELVENKKLPIKFVQAIQELVDVGPDKWVVVEKNREIKGLVFQRGVSGGGVSGKLENSKSLKFGAEEAILLLLGEGNSRDVLTSVMPSIEDSDEYMDNVNRLFSVPLVIRGPASKFGLHEETEPDLGGAFPAKAIPAKGLVPSTIHSMGLFLPETIKDHYYWASNYLHLMQRLEQKGIKPTPGSRGEHFLNELRSIWEYRRWNYPHKDGFGLNELANKEEILTNLKSLFNKYGP